MGVLWPDIRGELALDIFLQWKTGNWDITWIKSVKKYKMKKKKQQQPYLIETSYAESTKSEAI